MIIGLTGGIGSGKTTIAKALNEMGYSVYLTDQKAKEIIHNNLCVRSQVEYLFGSDIFKHGKLDTKRVAELVFNNPALLKEYEKVVHPAVLFDVEQWGKTLNGIGFVESAILYESGLNRYCQAVVAVTAPLEIRIQRTVERDKTNPQAVENRIKQQMSYDEIEKKADLVVINDGKKTISQLCLQIQDFCSKFVGI